MRTHKLALATALSTVLVGAAYASPEGHGHGHEGQTGMAQGHEEGMNHDTMGGAGKMFLEKRDIDGYSVSFHVMEANEGMNHGGSHNLMVKVEQGANVIGDLQANSKVIYPDGSDESKPLMKMGDWFMVGYDLKSAGKHQLMVLFKTPDGKKHFGGVHYGE
ncbi:hypothetical protein [Motiliproteus sp. SC1-56]|uniref:hypothetical protein n=1 Tax=Motiliproteus sp. SC1-56 TaxID=2799565 RepID=UPI001A8EA677|nr:hypothetical protein [Motiliproteus sp. SC1-56]